MPLSPVQKGAIGQFAFLVVALLTGKGEVEAYTPAIDNEGRDVEVRRHLRSRAAVGIQIKVAFSLSMRPNQQGFLILRFRLPEGRVQNDPRLWYFFAYFDVKRMRLHDVAFLVPAHVFHKLGLRGRRNGEIFFEFQASLSPGSHDRWSSYRVSLADLGKKLLGIIDTQNLQAVKGVLPLPSDAILVAASRAPIAMNSRLVRPVGKYDLIRKAVLQRSSLIGWYKGHQRVLSPHMLGTKDGEPHVLGYQFGGTSEKQLAPDGSPANWRCLRVSELTRVEVLPGVWHTAQKGKVHQRCIDQVDVSAYRPAAARRRLRRAA